MANQKPDAGQFDDVGFLIFGAFVSWPKYPALIFGTAPCGRNVRQERDGPTFA
jgi:hypothetical protein